MVPYVCDQLAIPQLPQASFALLLALLRAVATVVGAAVLAQVSGPRDVPGATLVTPGVALHQPAAAPSPCAG